ncbi:MAG: DsbA family protein [Anaerolineae bacterium]|nr:DsbA family protein [Anaerolineae bacterium]
MEAIKQRRIQIILIAGIAVLAAVIVIGSQILTNSPSSGSPFARYANIPQERLPDGGFLLGSADAPVTLVEFADFACPHCQEYAPEIERFVDEFVASGKAKLEYRLFISGADPTYGPYTARLAECAAEQNPDSFFPAHDVLFQIGRAQGRFNDQTARTLADRLDLNYSALLNCADKADQFQADGNLGVSLGVQSTPTLMIRFGDAKPQFIQVGGQTYDRGGVPYGILKAIVDSVQ